MKMRRENHAENAFICHSRRHCGVGRPAFAAGMHRGVTADQRKDAQKKLAGVILAALAALLCSAIDYFLNQEE